MLRADLWVEDAPVAVTALVCVVSDAVDQALEDLGEGDVEAWEPARLAPGDFADRLDRWLAGELPEMRRETPSLC